MGSGWGDTTGAGVLNNWGRRGLKVGAYKAVVYGIGSGGSHRVPFVQTQFQVSAAISWQMRLA